MFRLTATYAAGVHFYLRRNHRGFPYQLFCIMVSPEECDRVYGTPPCFHDSTAATFFRHFPESERGRTDEALALLEAMGLLSNVDVSALESSHSSVREWTQTRGRGHVPAFSNVSAEVFCRWVGSQYEGIRGKAAAKARRAEQQARRAEEQAAKKQRKRRGTSGGAWRAFVSERSRGSQLTRESVRQLAAEYRTLSGDERQRLFEIGQAATLASRQGQMGQTVRLLLGGLRSSNI
jgi:hypothetical protein